MCAAIRPVDQSAERWAKQVIAAALNPSPRMASMSNIWKVLWVVDPGLRTINRHSKNTLCVTIPSYVARDLGLEHHGHAEWIEIRPGQWALQKASANRIKWAIKKYYQLAQELGCRPITWALFRLELRKRKAA